MWPIISLKIEFKIIINISYQMKILYHYLNLAVLNNTVTRKENEIVDLLDEDMYFKFLYTESFPLPKIFVHVLG